MEPVSSSIIDTAPPLPPDTQPLEHQIAGHFHGRSESKYGLLEQKSTGFVLKPFISAPRGPREHQFYVDVFSIHAPVEIQNLRPFLPTFFGLYEFAGMQYLTLENILKDFQRPCIADVKIGRITYDSEASTEKKQKLKNNFPAAVDLGFQLCGWKTYRSTQKKYIYHHKQCARSIKKHEISSALANFFGAPESDHHPVVRDVIIRLRTLERVMSDLRGFTFLATSLLIVYDGAQHQSCTQSMPKVDVRLVDFAHVSTVNDENGNPINQPDDNFIFGLRSYIDHLETIADDKFIYLPLERLNHNDPSNASSNCYTTFM
ncbi:unnamed protein product [Rotaria magnacalcarata]|uniref:Kinase n=1 Tax=Rotaria magnacalcarata TaxID=392030 RepID=A0A815K2F9_9BILA|nr:unnamed protein product [Rotaria magnacalcarata]CAF1447388.1 unnamed protein product [Rotaria magnacalcarata]CAF2011187.1 unnamed protein product [Rotaria magnacalcarata]CAF2061051.1 unnamed protein product [Rotaria magnacalcarata]CAF2187646.1 unnamed protein product [Rotaria magnacalcarata]